MPLHKQQKAEKSFKRVLKNLNQLTRINTNKIRQELKAKKLITTNTFSFKCSLCLNQNHPGLKAATTYEATGVVM